jgi:hypothetical protein
MLADHDDRRVGHRDGLLVGEAVIKTAPPPA